MYTQTQCWIFGQDYFCNKLLSTDLMNFWFFDFGFFFVDNVLSGSPNNALIDNKAVPKYVLIDNKAVFGVRGARETSARHCEKMMSHVKTTNRPTTQSILAL